MSKILPPFSIAITPSSSGYKSIGALVWDNIPGFAILTGKNGSGKTQLLEVLAYHLTGTRPQGTDRLPVNVTTTGHSYASDEIGYMPSVMRFSGGIPASIANMDNVRRQAIQTAAQVHQYQHDITSAIRAKKLIKRFGRTPPHNAVPDQYQDLFDDDFEFAVDDIDITSSLGNLFFAYKIKLLEAIERGTPGFDKSGKALGPAPWDVVNNSLSKSGFPYEVISPRETSLTGTYLFRLRDKVTGNVIAAIDLSSGEKTLLQLVLWLFTANKDGIFPKLLLLDEPDAHLHPSMTQQFLDVIAETLVKHYGIRVILTSHSPSTVALAPEGSVFQLERGASSVTEVTSRADIISILTAGLVTVSRATKYCFVEDENDVEFYEAIYEILTDFGPSRDACALNPSPSMAFIPVSVGSGAAKLSGGKSNVSKWVAKLDADPLDRTFFGIIDRDTSNLATNRVKVLGRYSFENYLLDPLVIFALLLEEGTAPTVAGLKIKPGDEHLLRIQDEADLQAICDAVCTQIALTTTVLASSPTGRVTYTNGKTISVPSWVIDFRGHDLLPIVQSACGGPKMINRVRLLKALRRCRLIPEELAIVLSEIRKS